MHKNEIKGEKNRLNDSETELSIKYQNKYISGDKRRKKTDFVGSKLWKWCTYG